MAKFFLTFLKKNSHLLTEGIKKGLKRGEDWENVIKFVD